MASRTAVCAFSLAGTIGSRTVLAHLPISDIAYLIGAGLVSTNRLICKGVSLSCSLSAAAKFALQAGGLKFSAQARRHVRGHRDAAVAAMRHEAERGDVLARKLVEVGPHRGALLRHARHVGGRVLHAGNVLEFKQARHGVDRHVDDGAAGNIVDDDRDADGIVDRLVVLVEAFLGRLVVVGRDDQHRVGARLLGVARQLDGLGGRIRAGAGDDRHAASAWSTHHSTTCLCSSCDSVGLSPVVPTGTRPLVPSAICQSTMSRNAFSSSEPFLNGVTSAVKEPRKLVLAVMARLLHKEDQMTPIDIGSGAPMKALRVDGPINWRDS